VPELPAGAGPRVGAILNGLGATKYEELEWLWPDGWPVLQASI
jgi:hypothetical protein